MRHKRTIAAAVILALGLIPVPYLASPGWNVLVVDESGNPLPNMLVRLEYKNFSVEDSGHEIDMTTGMDGRVTFPTQMSSASFLRRCYYTAQSATAFVHASFGPNAYVNVFGDHLEGNATTGQFITFWTGHPDRMESRIVAHPTKN